MVFILLCIIIRTLRAMTLSRLMRRGLRQSLVAAWRIVARSAWIGSLSWKMTLFHSWSGYNTGHRLIDCLGSRFVILHRLQALWSCSSDAEGKGILHIVQRTTIYILLWLITVSSIILISYIGYGGILAMRYRGNPLATCIWTLSNPNEYVNILACAGHEPCWSPNTSIWYGMYS